MKFLERANSALIFLRERRTSASMLTCRRRIADKPLTLPQTFPLTLFRQEALRWAFRCAYGQRVLAMKTAFLGLCRMVAKEQTIWNFTLFWRFSVWIL